MPWDKGFNFRASSSYVTDGADTTYALDTDSYPVTRNGVTFGWTSVGVQSRDRATSPDPRTAGIHFGANQTFRVDLPSAGTYLITLGLGDQASPVTNAVLQVKDDSTNVISLTGMNATGDFYDAAGNKWGSASAWVSNQVPVSCVFASAILNVHLDTADTNPIISHLFISQQSAGGGSISIPVVMNQYRQRWG